MRIRDLINGSDYGEIMQRQMFCFGSSDDGGGDSDSSYSGGLDFSGEEGDDFSSGSYGNDYGGIGDSNDTFAAFRGSSEEEDAALQQDIAAAAALASGVQGLGDYQFESGDIGKLAELQTYKDLISGKGLNLGGFNPLANTQAILEAQKAVLGFDPVQTGLSQIADRMKQAQAGYGLPGLLGAGLGKIGGFTLNKMQEALKAGGRPVYDAQGNIRGVFSKGPFGLGEVYTGTPVEGVPGTGYDMGGPESEDIKPVDEETGRCPAGYTFDEDLQACRLDTGTGIGGGGVGGIGQPIEYTPGGYARMGLLDQPPQGLLEVGGQPYDFAAANRAWRQSTATRPEYFQDPYNLTGYTLLS